MRLLLAALLGAFLALAPSALAGLDAVLLVNDEGLRADLRSDAGHEQAHVSWSCVPDQDGRCTTSVDCAPGTLDCHAFREPDPPWPCAYQPDGSLACDPNGTHGNASAPPSAPPSALEPPPGAAPAASGLAEAACERLLAPGVCALPPGGLPAL